MMRVKPVTIAEILKVVAEFYGFTPGDLVSLDRSIHFNEPRQMCWLLTRELTDRGWENLAKEFGRDYSTCISGVKRIRARLEKEPLVAERLRLIQQALEVTP